MKLLGCTQGRVAAPWSKHAHAHAHAHALTRTHTHTHAHTHAHTHIHAGPSRTGEVIGEETAFVGMNKAIENRVCINMRRMRWAEPPRTMMLVEKTGG